MNDTPHGKFVKCAGPFDGRRANPCVDCGCVCVGYHRSDPERCWRCAYERKPDTQLKVPW